MSYKIRRGFTLIEVIIALSIFSIMAVISSTVLYTTFNARDKTMEHSVRLSKLQVAFVLIERDLSQIVNRPVTIHSIAHASVIGLIDKINFSRGGNINPLFEKKISSIMRVQYYLNNNNLIRSNEMAVDRAEPKAPQTEIIIRDVLELKFEYINKDGRVTEQWYTNNLPKAIRLTLNLKDWGKISQIYALKQSQIYSRKI